MPAVQATGLTRRFGDNTVVDHIDLSVAQGEIFGFLGPNGSGKTVTIKMLTGLLPITEGQARINGIDVATDPDGVRETIGYMSQKFSLYDDLTVLENLRFYGKAYGLPPDRLKHRIDDAIVRNALTPYLERLAGRLSGGWKQRLALACAMLHAPSILFLDEPTAGIDPVARRQLWDLLFELSGQGMTFFVTTHYMDEAERCSHLAYIYYGHLIAEGTPESLCAQPDINPPGTHRFEIATESVTRALHHLRQVEGVRSATIFGTSIHALVNESIQANDLERHLAKANMAVELVRPLKPNLEDVFVELTYRRQRTLEEGSA
jgi:ABC-type multidrug transport system ATPase subunit